jgi:hypothetical protein
MCSLGYDFVPDPGTYLMLLGGLSHLPLRLRSNVR